MIRIYLVDWRNNYGLDCAVIVGDLTLEQAKKIAEEQCGAWPFFDIQEINLSPIGGITITYPINQSNG